MTRAERLAQQEANAKEQLTERRKKLADIRKEQRAEEKRLRQQRYLLVGALADTAGLLTLSDADLAVLFAALAPLMHIPNPGAVLEALLSESEAPELVSAMAAPTYGRVAPVGAILDTVQ